MREGWRTWFDPKSGHYIGRNDELSLTASGATMEELCAEALEAEGLRAKSIAADSSTRRT